MNRVRHACCTGEENAVFTGSGDGLASHLLALLPAPVHDSSWYVSSGVVVAELQLVQWVTDPIMFVCVPAELASIFFTSVSQTGTAHKLSLEAFS